MIDMNKIIISLLCFMCFSCEGQKSYEAHVNCVYNLHVDTVSVYVEFGQSRAVARCADDFTLTGFPNSFSNVKIYNGAITNNSIQPMQFGTNTGEGYTNNSDQGNFSILTVNAALNDNVYVFKKAYGGEGLSEDASSTQFWDSNKTGSRWSEFQSDFLDFKSELVTQNKYPKIVKYNWMQWNNDGNSSSTQVIADSYEGLLNDLISNTFELMNPAPFYIQLADQRLNGGTYPYKATILAGQQNVVSNIPLAIGYSTEDCGFCDAVHYDDECHLEKGLNFPD